MPVDIIALKQSIQTLADQLGFEQVGFANVENAEHIAHYRDWLAKHYYGDMTYMASREALRSDPQSLLPKTLSVISVRLNYLPTPAKFSACLSDPNKAVISRYALGRDYHKLMRKKLAKLAQDIQYIAPSESRVFVDSAPILERSYAQKAGLGWIGKNTMLINQDAGSFFFLGEILTDLPLGQDQIPQNQCGECKACLQLCPTRAIVAPYTLDARRCISYLTIEHFGVIDESLRPLMGNRIYGCDDCQIVCPWNRYALGTQITDFLPRNAFDEIDLLELFRWDEPTFLTRTEGSPIRRIGHDRWLRNIAIALGNAPFSQEIKHTLMAKQKENPSELVQEHLRWAIEQQAKKEKSIYPIELMSKEQEKIIRTARKLLSHLD